jgi:DNA-binding MarR family transcriptional regulator
MKINIKSADGFTADKIKIKLNKSKNLQVKELENLPPEDIQLLLNLMKEMKGDSKKFTVVADDYIPKDKRRFVKMYVKETAKLIRESKSLSDLKVLTTMIELMNFDTGEIFVPNVRIAEILNMKAQAVGRSIKSLIEQGYLLVKEGTEKDKTKTYILNETYFKYGR